MKKVCIVASSLTHGGAEKAAANQSLIFFDLGYEVHIVTVSSGISYHCKGQVYDLGQFKSTSDSHLDRLSRLLKFRSFLKAQNFDLIIDNRPRNQAYREFIITKFIYKVPVIYMLHSYEVSLAFTKYSWLNTWLYKNKMMVAVSKLGAKKFKKLFDLQNVNTIYNALDFEAIKEQSEMPLDLPFEGSYIMFYGRIQNSSKNLTLLLEAYMASKLIEHQIKLIVIGDGEDLAQLKAYCEELKISNNVLFTGFKTNPFPYLKKALFTVLTSRSEGFGLVIPESLSLGVPVVSVDCEAGPKELITPNINGILVDNYSVKALAEAMNKMTLNKNFRRVCSQKAKQSVSQFSLETVRNSWKNYLDSQGL
ncbi:glycosyltransferase [Gaetbulibacter sp. M240]|uniref:glycosyltransferase n=1 Tax=Gaetbulibacter sp. M240 TaxID=3126511 RepID=UPI00374E8662